METPLALSSSRVEHPWQCDSGTYTEVDEIGNGAYATVLRGRNKATGAEVALKKIIMSINEEGVPQSVIREVSLLKRFGCDNHPNIVRLLDVCHGLSEDGRRLYMNLVFEYCPQDLAMYLTSVANSPTPVLPPSTIRRMMGEILAGLKYLHNQAVVHRDLKPQNILLSSNGQLKLADYGLARMFSLQTAMTTVVVTLWYRAPELLLQCGYGFGVDVWSVGCMFAELYRLRPLFPGSSEVDQLIKIFEVIGLPPLQAWPHDAVVDYRSFEFLKVTTTLQQAAPTSEPVAFDLLKKMLAFSADHRLTVDEILKHEYFLIAPQQHSS